MISILIPVYNKNVQKLVESLMDQALDLEINFEIICMDDISELNTKKKNRVLNSIEYVNYIESSEKLGRSRIRNRLSKLARYPWLLYLDCDSEINNGHFLQNYLRQIQNIRSPDVICGGTKYSEAKPAINKVLHWKYGKYREELPACIRNRKPLISFHSNNFIVKAEVIKTVIFDSAIQEYGYEDLAWANSIHRADYSLSHVDNPVLHKGLKSFDQYMNDIKASLFNLDRLYELNKIPETNLLRSYKLLKSWGLRGLLLFMGSRFEKQLILLISGPNPSLRVFDLLKLFYFSEIRAKHI